MTPCTNMMNYAASLTERRTLSSPQSIDKIIPIRMHAHEELLGADFYEHELKHGGVGVSRAVSVLQHYYRDVDPSIETRKGNKGEDSGQQQTKGEIS